MLKTAQVNPGWESFDKLGNMGNMFNSGSTNFNISDKTQFFLDIFRYLNDFLIHFRQIHETIDTKSKIVWLYIHILNN